MDPPGVFERLPSSHSGLLAQSDGGLRLNLSVSATPRAHWSRLTASWRSSVHAESSLLMGASVMNAAFGFLFWTAAARLYRPHDVGLAAAALAVIGLLATLSGLGLDYALVRFLPGASRPQEIINSCLTIGSVVAFLVAVTFLAGLGLWSPAMVPVRSDPVYAVSLVVAAVLTTVTVFMAAVYLSRKNARMVFGQSL